MKNKQEESDLWSEERRFWESGCTCICGADEAGAGPLAGPVYAAAVILPPGRLIPGLNDSKKLTARQREILFDQICAEAQAYAVASVDEQTIDGIDILNARIRAMDEAIRQLVPKPDFALIDGNRDHGSRCSIAIPHALLVKGDSRSANIAAASVLAKVSRDRYMERLSEKYPEYGFGQHKGYGTKQHYAALDRCGPCPAHRRSFLVKWAARRSECKKVDG